jgi:hypothetical protein
VRWSASVTRGAKVSEPYPTELSEASRTFLCGARETRWFGFAAACVAMSGGVAVILEQNGATPRARRSRNQARGRQVRRADEKRGARERRRSGVRPPSRLGNFFSFLF